MIMLSFLAKHPQIKWTQEMDPSLGKFELGRSSGLIDESPS